MLGGMASRPLPEGDLPTTPGAGGPPVTLASVQAAAQRLAGVARRTPLLSSASLDAACGGRVRLKAECFQRSGSFKFRGAYNRLSQLTSEERGAGVVAYSSGNHGAAVALAARLLGVVATIVAPANGPQGKLAAITGYGATLRPYDPETEQRETVAEEIHERTGAVLVPPFDDPAIMSGQGTAGLELVEDGGALDVALVPVGGGGLVAGTGTVLSALAPGCRIFGVEPAGADDTRRSLAASARVRLDRVDTIADGLRASTPGSLTFPVNRRNLAGVLSVGDDQIVEAMRFLFERLKIVVEPSGAVGVAALLSGAIDVSGLRVAVVLSGGNVDAARFAELVG